MTFSLVARAKAVAASLRRPRTALSLVASSVIVLGASACDTDDGRAMQPPSTQQSPSIPAPTTTVGGAGGAGQAGDAGAVQQAPSLSGGVSAAPTTGAVVGTPAPGDFSMSLPFDDGTNIPFEFTCRGDGVAPAITFWGVPRNVVEMAVVVVDQDAEGFVHWVVTGIDPGARVVRGGPNGTGTEALNGFGDLGWGPPCPPKGDGAHTYRFTMHGLRRPLDVEPGTAGETLRRQIRAASVASVTATGTYRQ